MKNRNLLPLFIGLIVLIITIIISYFSYKTKVYMTIYTPKDSYASSFAKKHLINIENINESEALDLTLNIEEFTYNIVNNEIEIIKYDGISKRLVIPEYIEGYKVTKLNFKNSKVDTIILSKYVNDINEDLLKNINIECYSNEFCNKLKENNYNVEIIPSSVKINFDNQLEDISYELKNDEIEITRYTGSKNEFIVPSTINGYDVTKLSFDSLYILDIYIPDSIKNINEDFTSKLLNKVFNNSLVIMILGFIIFLINIVTLKNDSKDKTKNIIIYILSILYLIILSIKSLSVTDYFINYNNEIKNLLIITIIYQVIIILLRIALKQSVKYEKNIKEKTNFIDECLLLIDDSDEYKLRDAIRYSDPMSINEVESIEKEILVLIKKINKDNASKIKELLKERNNLIKLKK